MSDPQRWIVVGASGSGKTRFARELVGRLRDRHPAGIAVYDPTDSADSWRIDGAIEAERRIDYLRAVAAGARAIVYRTDSPDWTTGQAGGSCLPGLRGRLVVVDEAHHYAPHQQAAPALRELLRRGRHLGCSVVIISQRPADLPPAAWTSATHAAIFRMAHRADVEAVARNLGMPRGWSPTWMRPAGAPPAASVPLIWSVEQALSGDPIRVLGDARSERDAHNVDGFLAKQ